MANKLSDLMTNALGRVKNDPHHTGHAMRVKRALINPVTADAAGVLYVLGRFNANDHLYGFFGYASSGGPFAAMTDVDMGVWVAGDWNQGDQVAVDEDCFANALDLDVLGPSSGADYMTTDIIGLTFWEIAGLAAEPSQGTQYDIVMRSNADPVPTVSGAAGIFIFTYSTGY